MSMKEALKYGSMGFCLALLLTGLVLLIVFLVRKNKRNNSKVQNVEVPIPVFTNGRSATSTNIYEPELT